MVSYEFECERGAGGADVSRSSLDIPMAQGSSSGFAYLSDPQESLAPWSQMQGSEFVQGSSGAFPCQLSEK